MKFRSRQRQESSFQVAPMLDVFMILLCFFLPVLWGERRFKFIVPYSIVFPLAIYALFAIVLKVHFEPSPLAFW